LSKASQSLPHFIGRKPTSRVSKKIRQSTMQALKANVVAICKLVEQPEDAMHFNLLSDS